MRIESRDHTGIDGFGRQWHIGQLAIEWYIERPPQSWLRFAGNLSVRYYDR